MKKKKENKCREQKAGRWNQLPVNVIIMLLQTSTDGNTTTSVLSFIATKADAGRHLSCQAENQIMGSAPIEDGWILQIQCKLINDDGSSTASSLPPGIVRPLFPYLFRRIQPTLTVYRRSWFTDTPETQIQLGTSLNPNAIREGTDVYFDCLIQAEPSVYKVEWRHQVSEDIIFLFRTIYTCFLFSVHYFINEFGILVRLCICTKIQYTVMCVCTKIQYTDEKKYSFLILLSMHKYLGKKQLVKKFLY